MLMRPTPPTHGLDCCAPFSPKASFTISAFEVPLRGSGGCAAVKASSP
jgi:hypothetical protein